MEAITAWVEMEYLKPTTARKPFLPVLIVSHQDKEVGASKLDHLRSITSQPPRSTLSNI